MQPSWLIHVPPALRKEPCLQLPALSQQGNHVRLPNSAFSGLSPLSFSPHPGSDLTLSPDLKERDRDLALWPSPHFLPSLRLRPGAIPGLLTRPHCVGGMGRAACQFRKGGAALGRPKSLSAAQQNCKCHHIPAQEERASKRGKQAPNNGGSSTLCLSPSWSHRAAQQEAPQDAGGSCSQFLR